MVFKKKTKKKTTKTTPVADDPVMEPQQKTGTPDLSEVLQFYITATRYMRQAGQPAPEIIHASPGAPVRVTLPRWILRTFVNKNKSQTQRYIEQPEDVSMRRVEPKALRPSHATVKGMPHAAERMVATETHGS